MRASIERRSFLWFVLAAMLVAFAPATARADALSDAENALEAGQVDDAIAKYRAAAEASPGDAKAHLGLGLALEKKRNWQAALSSFERASQIDARLADP